MIKKLLKKSQGYKTYTGLFLATLGVLGLGDLISEGELTEIVNTTVTLVGILIAVYGRAVAKLRK